MADRSVSVAMKADVDQYRRDMRRAASATEDVSDAVDQAGRKSTELKKLSTAAQSAKRGLEAVGNTDRDVLRAASAMDQAEGEAQQLDRAIDRLEAEVRDLNRELLRTGDIEVFEKLERQRGALQMLRRMRREIGDIDEAGRSMTRTLSDGLRALPSQLTGALIISLVGAAVVAAPLIAGAVAGAVVGAVGAGGIVGGIAAAAQDARVQAAARGMVDRIGAEFDALGEFFEVPVIESLGILGDSARGVLRDLRPELQALAPVVVDLARGIAGLVEQAAPGIAVALRESVPILQAIAAELPGLGHDLGQMFAILSRGGDDARDALVGTINLLGGIAQATAYTIFLFTKLFGLLDQSADIPILGGPAKAVQSLLGIADGADKAALKTGEMSDVFSGLDPTLAGATGSLEETTEAAVHNADSLRGAAEAAGSLSEALQILNGDALSARAAERQFEEAVDSARESLEEHGATLDRDTEAGRANEEQLDRIATSTQQWADATFERTGSEEQAIEVMKRGRKQLIDTAQQMGLNKEEARQLADEILGIPEDWRGNFSSNADEETDRVNALRRAIDRIDRFVRITYEHHQTGALPGVGGTPTIQRWGGVVAAQRGMLVPAHITSSPTVLFGERATGQEAFIPRNGDDARSKAILAEAASWYGMTLAQASRFSTSGAGGARVMSAGLDSAPIFVDNHIEIGGEVVRVVRTEISGTTRELRRRVDARSGAR